jgi:hypothetical protein
VALPRSGHAYRALSADDRLAVAAGCRDRAAGRARGTPERQLHAIDARALRDQLDDAFTFIPDQRRPVAEVCAQRVPFVTRGLRLGLRWRTQRRRRPLHHETNSDTPLTLRGLITRPTRRPRGRDTRAGRPGRDTAAIDGDGAFLISRIRLRKIARQHVHDDDRRAAQCAAQGPLQRHLPGLPRQRAAADAALNRLPGVRLIGAPHAACRAHATCEGPGGGAQPATVCRGGPPARAAVRDVLAREQVVITDDDIARIPPARGRASDLPSR